MKNSLKDFDVAFSKNSFRGDLQAENIFSFIDKSSYLCLSAPHSTSSFRNDSVKPSDLYTGAICLYLSHLLGFSAIVRNKYTDYKYLINDFVFENNLDKHYFIDVHGMSSEQEFEMAIGIADANESDYAKELEFIKTTAEKYSISYIVNHKNYSGRFGFTGKLQKISGRTNIIQIEFRKDMRDFYNNPEVVSSKMLPFLIDFATFIEKNKIKQIKCVSSG